MKQDNDNDQIRVMTQEDVAEVMRLESQQAGTSWTTGKLSSCLYAGDRAYVMIFEGRLVGYIIARVSEAVCDILTLAVDPLYQRQGRGMALLRHVMEGCNDMILEVRKSNVAARALYKRAGFRRVGRRKAYYTDNYEDAIVMRLSR